MCTPARAAPSGRRHPHKTGLAFFVLLNQPTLDEREVTLGERFRARGYATHMIGKWHPGSARRAWLPANRGFDSFFGYAEARRANTSRHRRDRRVDLHPGLGARLHAARERRVARGLHAPAAAALALDAAGHDLWRNELPLHRPRDGRRALGGSSRPKPGPRRRRRPTAALPLLRGADAARAFHGAPRHRRARRMGFGGRDVRPTPPPGCRLDEQVGAVFGVRGEKKAPRLLVSGDNGLEAGTVRWPAFPFRGAKRTVFEGGIRTPSFIYAPRIVAPAPPRQTRIVDAGPTLLGLVGATVRGSTGATCDRTGSSHHGRPRALLRQGGLGGAAVRGQRTLNGGCLYATCNTSVGPTTTTTGPIPRAGPRVEASSTWQRPGQRPGRRKRPSCRPRRAPRVAVRRGDRLAPSWLDTPGIRRRPPLHGRRWVSWRRRTVCCCCMHCGYSYHGNPKNPFWD